MKPRILSTVRLSFALATALAALLAAPVQAGNTYYWDVNGIAGFSTITGAWNGTNAFWNTDSTGATSGTFVASPTLNDDLYINGGTTGTITLSGAQAASSLTFAVNVAATLTSGTSLTIGGGGAKSGIFVASGDNAANTINSPLILNSTSTALNFSNAGTGLLTLGAVTGAAAGLQTVTVGSSSSGGITLNGAITNGGGGGNVGLTINSSGTGLVTLLSTSNTYSGKTLVSGGTVRFGNTWSNSWTSGSLSTNSNLEINGGILQVWYNTSRLLGTAANQIQITGGRSGFTQLQGDQSGNIFWNFGNSATTITWGTTTFNPSTLVLNDVGAGATLRMNNPFDLNGAARTIEVSATGASGVYGTYATMEGNLSGTGGGSLVKTGAGTLILNGTNSYNGGTTISNGALWFNKLVSMPNSGAVAVNDGTILSIGVGNTGGWTTTGASNGSIAGLLSGIGGQSGGTVSYTGNVKVGLNITGTQSYAGVIADVGTTLGIHIGNKDGGSTDAAFPATGNLTLSNQNTYTGGTTINMGTLTLGHATNTLADTGAVTVNGGTLALGANSDTVGAVTLTSGSITSSTGVLTASSVDAQGGTITAKLGGSGVTKSTAGTLTVSGANLPGLTVTNGTVNFAGTNTISGSLTVNAGVVNFAGTNTFSSGVTLNAGTLYTGSSASALGAGTWVIAGGRIDIAASSAGAGTTLTTTNANTWNASWTIGRGSTGNGTWNNNGDILLGGNVTVASANNNTYLNLGGVISDGASSYSLTVNTNSVTLSNANTYKGGTSFSTALNINNSGSGGTSSAIGTGTLNLSGGTIDNTSANDVILSTNNVFNFTNNTVFTGTKSLSNGTGNFTINGTRTITVTNSGSRLTLGGNQTTAVAGGIVKAGAGTLTLLGSGVQTGAATISAGVLEVGVINNAGTVGGSSLGNVTTAAANLLMANGTTLRYVGGTNATTDRSFTINGTTDGHGATIESSGVGTLSYSGGPALAYGTNNQTRTLTLGGTNTGANTFGKVIANNGTGLTSLVKSGVGTWVLNQTNTYTGTTSVNAGKLVVNGSLAASAVTVAAGTTTDTPVAKLGGSGNGTTTGKIGGNVILSAESVLGYKNGGILAPTAAASGVMLSVAGTTTFGAGSIFEWDLNATNGTDPGALPDQGSYGQLAGTSTISGGAAVFKIVLGTNLFTNDFWNTNKSWTNVFTGTGAPTSLTALFNSFSGGDGTSTVSSAGIVTGQGFFAFDSGSRALTWTAVPEPTSALAGILLGTGLLRRRRK